jgi:hypothetical protein
MSNESQAHPPRDVILGHMLGGFAVSQALHVAAKLAIVDVLRDGPKTPHQIADAVGAHAPTLRRLLRFLTTVDILTEDGDGRFTTTPLGDLLRSDHPQSARPWALLLGGPLIWRPWGDLYESIITGQPAFNRIYGEPFFAYLQHNPAAAAVFNGAMTHTNSFAAILDAYDFADVTKLVDVGGGQGLLLRDILERYPHTSGILYDLPSVVADAHIIKDSAVAGRCELVGGDMFESVPAGGDTYLLKWIIHDWSDAEAIQILRNCRQAIADQGRILLVEQILTPSNQPDPATGADLMMLILVTGRERTKEEFGDLYAAAGFQITCVIPAGGEWIIEGVPV